MTKENLSLMTAGNHIIVNNFDSEKYSYFWAYVAKLLPKKLVYHCILIAIVKATSGKYSQQVVPDLTVMDTMQRWTEG